MIKHNGITINKVYKTGAVDNKAYFNGSVVYGSGSVPPTPPVTDDYVTFTILSDGYINWFNNNGLWRTIEYNKNNTGWNEIVSTGDTINVVTGDVVKFRGQNSTYGTASTTYTTFSGTTCNFNLSGHVYTLIDYTDKATAASSAGQRTFNYLFRLTPVVDASGLVLADADFHPEPGYMHFGMFFQCTSLTTAPNLKYCKGGQQSFAQMFNGCTSLATAPEMPDDSGAYSNKYVNMFRLTAITKIVLKATDTLTTACCNGMCVGCTSLTEAEILPTQTPPSNGFATCFSGCTSLTSVKYMMTIKPATTYNKNWLASVAAGGTLTLNSNSDGTLERSVNGCPTNWTPVYITP